MSMHTGHNSLQHYLTQTVARRVEITAAAATPADAHHALCQLQQAIVLDH